MQVIATFEKFCIPMSTEALKGDQSLKMPSDSISEDVIFQNFLGGHAPDPPSIGMLDMPVYTMTMHIPASPISTMMTNLSVSPLSKV